MGSQSFGGWADSARQPVDTARQALGEAGEAARRGYDDASRQARQAYEQMEDAIGPYRQSLEDAIVSNPVKAVGVSLAVGVLLGWLIKRS
ncbi:DUF883 family protein [Paludisphaera mucosa]|uniref:DUF883 domain-containing protein n=1 Tax=Paludisphaera mucosa TaxID=3030827 RepID=A0ABT6FKR3_9BACT|nr:hypothetical protein [Paludisphaera mucosa]MDG3008096.1 hypothetical protein [Paludisphaera mucosa]